MICVRCRAWLRLDGQVTWKFCMPESKGTIIPWLTAFTGLKPQDSGSMHVPSTAPGPPPDRLRIHRSEAADDEAKIGASCVSITCKSAGTRVYKLRVCLDSA